MLAKMTPLESINSQDGSNPDEVSIDFMTEQNIGILRLDLVLLTFSLM